MMSQILKSLDFTKAQKSRYLEDETFFLHIKGNFMAKKVLYKRYPLTNQVKSSSMKDLM